MATHGVPGPQLSPDGQWWWDGQAWQPVQAPAPQPAAASAPSAPAAAQKPEWLDQMPGWLSSSPAPASAGPAPTPTTEVVYDPGPVPVWQQSAPRSASHPLIFMTAGLVLAVLAIGGFAFGAQLLGNHNDLTANTRPEPTSLLSDYERADRFLNVDLAPSLTETTNALPAVKSSCTSTLPPACRDALIKLAKAMSDADDAMTQNQRDIPACIGPQMSQFKADWTGMEQGVSLAIQGYQASSRDLTVQGLQKFASVAQYIQADVDRIKAAENTCKK